jgi:plasmid maintenance system antidote protein VapI
VEKTKHMTTIELQQKPHVERPEAYDPDNLLNAILQQMKLRNDAALARTLEVSPPVISKIRQRRLPIGASLLIRMHEVTGKSIRHLRELMGDRREKYRLSSAQGRPVPADKREG